MLLDWVVFVAGNLLKQTPLHVHGLVALLLLISESVLLMLFECDVLLLYRRFEGTVAGLVVGDQV